MSSNSRSLRGSGVMVKGGSYCSIYEHDSKNRCDVNLKSLVNKGVLTLLKQRINKRGDGRALSKNNQKAQKHKEDNDGRKPVALAYFKEFPEFFEYG